MSVILGAREIIGIRCRAAHPDFPGLECRAKLAGAGEDVKVHRGHVHVPGGIQIKCRRCGTLYTLQGRAGTDAVQ